MKYLSQALLAFAVSFVFVTGIAKAQEIVPMARLKGPLWNSENAGLQHRIYIKFSKNLEKGNLARLVSASYFWSLDNFEISAPTPIFLNVDTGNIVTENGTVIGISLFQHPGVVEPPGVEVNEGFSIHKDKISIYEGPHKIVINP